MILNFMLMTAFAGTSEQNYTIGTNDPGTTDASCTQDWCQIANDQSYQSCYTQWYSQNARDDYEGCEMWWDDGSCTVDIDGCTVLGEQPNCDISCEPAHPSRSGWYDFFYVSNCVATCPICCVLIN